MLNDTICAISTALKDGAISIVRMSGPDSFDIIRRISDVKKIEANRIVYSHIRDEGEVIDEVLISFFEQGHSYTREDMAEINCHGGVFVSRLILNLLLKEGCRLAEAGEFTRRAYLNGRIDLSMADSINDLIRAQNKIQAYSAIRGLDGSVERLLEPLMQEMRDVIAMIEVNIDYPEYEDEVQMSNEVIRPYLQKWIPQCKEMIEKAERFRVVKDGLDTIIIGRPNVGKSSLLNALLEEDKAIVTDIAGTTRDLVEGKVKLDNITLNLIDTAGIRDDAEAIEKIGIEKTMKAIDKAQLIILVIDASDINEKDEELINTYKDRNLVVVYNKADLNKYGEIAICAKNGDIKALKDHLNQMYQDDIDLVNEDILNNERQIALMRNCLEELNNMYKSIDVDTSDVIVTYLSEAYDYLCQILGKEYREDLIDHMFKNFCLGK